MSNIKDPLKPWIIVAPHLIYPLRNGADLYAAGVAKGISFFTKSLLIGASTLEWFENGVVVKTATIENKIRGKLQSAIISLVTGKSYQEAKFVTKAYKKFIAGFSAEPDNNIAFSFNSSAVLAPLISGVKGHKVVLTHNFDIAFFKNMQESLKNPVSKLAAYRTLSYTHRFLEKNQCAFVYAHNNEADEKDYAALYPAMEHALLKVGVDSPNVQTMLEVRKVNMQPGETIKLCFTGYLGGQQNLDALLHFADKFWQQLLKRFGNKIRFQAIGSSPSPQVLELCKKMDWELLPDLNDEAFGQAVAACHFSVLPFAFTSGTKHKLFTSVANGVPFLATECIGVQVGQYPTCCLFSDDAEQWASHIELWQTALLDIGTLKPLHAFIDEHSWKKACGDFMGQLQHTSLKL